MPDTPPRLDWDRLAPHPEHQTVGCARRRAHWSLQQCVARFRSPRFPECAGCTDGLARSWAYAEMTGEIGAPCPAPAAPRRPAPRPEPVADRGRPCPCGCGGRVPEYSGVGRPRLYAGPECKRRMQRQRRERQEQARLRVGEELDALLAGFYGGCNA